MNKNHFEQLAKGLIKPQDIALEGNLTPQESNALISLVFGDPFLAKVQTIRMQKLERKIDAFDMASRQLQSVDQGSEPTDAQKMALLGKGKKLVTKNVQLFAEITLDFIRDNANNPKLVKEIENKIGTVLQNDLVDLAFNGEKDDNSGGFLALNKGWVELAKANAPASQKIDIDFSVDSPQDSLFAIVQKADKRFRKKSVLVMSVADADRYAYKLAGHVTGHALLADSPLRRFEGYLIEPSEYMPDGHVLFTPMKNMVYGMHTSVHRVRNMHATKRVVELVYDMAVDFEFAIDEAVVLGKPATVA